MGILSTLAKLEIIESRNLAKTTFMQHFELVRVQTLNGAMEYMAK